MPLLILDEPRWRERQAAHQARVDAWLRPHLRRRHCGVRHPVHDFLFSYYSYRPAQLRRWHPGAAVVLAGGTEPDAWYRMTPRGPTLDVAAFRDRRGAALSWIGELLTATAGRPAHFGCFGMHEWAMVYRQTSQELRHSAWPLRLSAGETAAVPHEVGVRCSHFDAFRFFTPAARVLNVLQPTRATQPALEQPGCLHTGMDLYKWAYKLSPAVSSDLVADCFALARQIRTLDMRASPYDLRELGLEPVAVETPQGRAEYAAAQRDFAARAAPLRRRLIKAVDVLRQGRAADRATVRQ